MIMSRSIISDKVQHNEKVVSKYFNKNKVEMDDSLLDFQDSKKTCKGPKKCKKPVTKKQPKRTKKKETGQKDIRTALKPKKNDLLRYATEFHNVCLKNGVDVDSEQLQIAIALSKSLNDFENQSKPSTSQTQKSEGLSNQDRSNRIRTTLLEYGFSVPEIKKTTEVKRRVRKCLKNSKLLLSSEEEKRQKVADKVSQILFKFSIDSADVTIVDEQNLSSRNTQNIFSISGNNYQYLKNDQCFYAGNLVDFSANTVGCLLKDWSKIPGRPKSPPAIAANEGHFTDYIKCQEDLDVLLTSTMKVVNKQVHSKKHCSEKQGTTVHNKGELCMDRNVGNNTNNFDNNTENYKEKNTNKPFELHTPNTTMAVPLTKRNMSPDLFDDEPSISELTCSIEAPKSVGLKTLEHSVSEKTLTTLNHVTLSIDATKIRSNEFMDSTDCITVVKQALQPINSSILDLSQASNKSQDLITNLNSSNSITLSNGLALSLRERNADFQVGPKEDENTAQTLKNPENYKQINGQSDFKIKYDEFALAQDSTAPAEIIDVEIEITTNKSRLFEDFTFHHSSVSENNSSKEIMNSRDCETSNLNEDLVQVCEEDIVNLTQSSASSNAEYFDSEVVNVNVTHIVDPVLDCISLDSSSKSALENRDNETLEYDENVCINVKGDEFGDLVKNGNKSEILTESRDKTMEKCVSIIEDDVNLDLIKNPSNKIFSDNSKENNLSQNEPNISSSQCSAVFEISDEELDYSMQYFKSIKHNLSHEHTRKVEISNDLQDNEVMHGVGDFALADVPESPINHFTNDLSHKWNETPNSRRFSCNDSLPVVEIMGTKVKLKSPETKITSNNPFTPIQDTKMIDSKLVCNEATPSHSGYIIKTKDVTPMLDYASLNTPDRNKELDKYGIKPFKRKRAIRLLEYLYCQTHPIVEICDAEDLEAPTKRSKASSPSQDQADLASSSNAPQTCKNDDRLNENDFAENTKLYEVKNFIPVLKNIPCHAEDWVFQKREKAKVHGCRVPLHVAFHNYMSARPALREAVLRYDPVSIELIHKQLAKDGHRYDPKDLLRFLDKRCITVKTADTGARTGNKRQHRKS